MKTIITLLALLILTGANAQTETSRPDYSLIAKNISDKSSPYYYATLMERYNNADTSMTVDELRHLYYGFALQPKHTDEGLHEQTMQTLQKILQKPYPTLADMDEVISLTNILLDENPFSITIKQYRQYCLKQLGRYDQAITERDQAEMIADAILSSGNGTARNNSIHVIDVSNEYEIATIMGYTPVNGEYVATNGIVDYLALNKNLYNLKGLYFEVTDVPKQVTGL